MSEWIDGPPESVDGRSDHFAPGTLLDTARGLILVGHINDLGGVCNDCSVDFEPGEIRRHKVVWTP